MATHQSSPEHELAAEVDRLRELVKLKDEELGRIEEARTSLYRSLQECEGEVRKLRSKKLRFWRKSRTDLEQ